MTIPTAVGIDLSLTAAGVATPAGLFTVGEKAPSGATLDARRRRIARQVSRVIDLALVEPLDEAVVAIESPAQHAKTPGQHDRSGLWWGVVQQLASWPGVFVVDVGIAALKKYATGKGNAGKDEVLAAVVRRYADEPVSDNNQADALVLRAMVLDHYGAPLADVPARNREALGSVAWPEIVR